MVFFFAIGQYHEGPIHTYTSYKVLFTLGPALQVWTQYVGLVSTWVLLKNFYRSLVLVLGPGLISMKHEPPPLTQANGKGVLTLVLCMVRRPPWQWLHKFEPTRNWNLDSNLQLGWNLWDTSQSEWINSGALSPWRMDGDVHMGKHFLVLFLNHSYPECLPMHTNHQHASTYLVVTIQFIYLPTFIVTMYIPLLTHSYKESVVYIPSGIHGTKLWT